MKDIRKNVKPMKKISFWGMMVSTGGGGEFNFISEYIRMLFMLDLSPTTELSKQYPIIKMNIAIYGNR